MQSSLFLLFVSAIANTLLSILGLRRLFSRTQSFSETLALSSQNKPPLILALSHRAFALVPIDAQFPTLPRLSKTQLNTSRRPPESILNISLSRELPLAKLERQIVTPSIHPPEDFQIMIPRNSRTTCEGSCSSPTNLIGLSITSPGSLML